MKPDRISIIVNMTGGVLQGASRDTDIPVDIYVTDYDFDGEERTYQIPQPNGEVSEASMYDTGTEYNPEWVDKVVTMFIEGDDDEN